MAEVDRGWRHRVALLRFVHGGSRWCRPPITPHGQSAVSDLRQLEEVATRDIHDPEWRAHSC